MVVNSGHNHAEQIPIAIWIAWCNYFSIKHFRRQVSIDLVGGKDGEEGSGLVAIKSPLVAVDYDPAGKGNDFVISYGDEAVPSRHMISAPAVLWQLKDGTGTVMGFQVEDEIGGVTVVTLE